LLALTRLCLLHYPVDEKNQNHHTGAAGRWPENSFLRLRHHGSGQAVRSFLHQETPNCPKDLPLVRSSQAEPSVPRRPENAPRRPVAGNQW
jgi:hypothetical protein